VFFIWLSLTLLAAIYFITSRLVSFDPELKLSGENSHSIINQIREIDELKTVNLSNTIIHFTSNNCSCSQFSEEHKLSINKDAEVENFTVININISDKLSTIIPSTPSILILSEVEDLLYFGPYSIGLACSESNGYVETVMKNYAQGYTSDLVISDAKGCYCNV
jgi:hypothetical protein